LRDASAGRGVVSFDLRCERTNTRSSPSPGAAHAALEGTAFFREVRVCSHAQGWRRADANRAIDALTGHDVGDAGLLGLSHAGWPRQR